MEGYGLGVGPRFGMGMGFGSMYPGRGFMWGNRLGAKPNPAAAPRSTAQPTATAEGIQQAAQQQGVALGNQANNNVPQGTGLEVTAGDRDWCSALAQGFQGRLRGDYRLVKRASGMFNASLPGAAPALGTATPPSSGVNLQNTAKPQLPPMRQSIGTNLPTSGLTNGSTLGSTAGSGLSGKSPGMSGSSGAGATKLGSVDYYLGGVFSTARREGSNRVGSRVAGSEKAAQELPQIISRVQRSQLPLLAGVGNLWSKVASQDNSQPQRSATGESRGLAYLHKADDYDRGPDAWKNSGKYLKFGKRLTAQPDLERGRHQSHSKQAATMPGQAVGPSNPDLEEPAGTLDADTTDDRTLGGESPGQDAMFKTATGGMFPAQVIRHIVPLEDRRTQFTPEEDEQIAHHERSWTPKFIQVDSTPIPSLLASPTKQGILKGLLGAAAGGVLGGVGGHLAGGHAALGAGLGALAGGGLGAFNGYRKRYFHNAHVKEIMRRLPANSTYRDYDTEERLLNSFKERFKHANDDQFTDWLLAAWNG